MSTNLRNIQMVDLKSQYHRIKSEIDEAVLGAIDNTAYINVNVKASPESSYEI